MQPNNDISRALNAVAPNIEDQPPRQNMAQAGGARSGEDIVFRDQPKKNKGMIAGMVILALLAAGGIGFGVWAFLSGNQKETELNSKVSDYENQISVLNSQLEEKDIAIEEANLKIKALTGGSEQIDLNAETALSLLQKRAEEMGADYTIDSAAVYAKGLDEANESYLITYSENHGNNEVVEGVYVVFIKDENGEWQFELPGFSGTTEEFMSQYTVIE